MDENAGANACEVSAKIAGQLTKPTLTTGLHLERQNLEARLAEVNEAIDALTANPEIERVLNLIGKVKNRY